MIAIRDLVKRFGSQSVLDGATLTVAKGEVAAVMGPSGCGKTTMLRCLNGLESFDSGQVELAGLALGPEIGGRAGRQRLAQLRRRVGMVFQQFNLFGHMTVLENVIEAPMTVLGQSREEAISRAQPLLERVGLADKRSARPQNLSGGQQQRVAIARALAMQPEVMLFDEPTSALDPRMAAEVESVMGDLARDGQTMLIVTHFPQLVRRTAGTLHVMAQGRVVASGTPEEVLASPHGLWLEHST